MTPPRATLPLDGRRLRRAVVLLVVLAVGYTLASLFVPELRVSVANPGYRVAIEIVGLCALLFAAVVLVLLDARDATPVRDALVAGLVVLALANAVFGIGPALLDVRPQVDRGLGLYPWVAARHLAGLLFIAAALGRPRLGLRSTVGLALLTLLVVELVLIGFGDRLPVPVAVRADGVTVEVVAPLVHVVLQLVPGLLFAVGSWLAARLYLDSGTPVARWLSLALTLQVVAQVHEILYPAMLGPLITSADVLRLGAFSLLLVGSVAQVRTLYRARSATVRIQELDLRDHTDLVARLSGSAEHEELFRSIVSHELATPIATIRNYTELLAATLPEPHAPGFDDAIANMRGEADRLLELVGRIDELRDLGGASFRCELRPARIVPLLEEAGRFVTGMGSMHTVSVECEDVRVLADPVRLGQLLRNVLVNAMRFSPPGTAIELDGRVDVTDLELTVRDHGPGIPPHERELVLRRSGRGGNAVGTEGRGLGLFVAERIAVGHGGSLTLGDGPDGSGTCVNIRLRVAT